MTDAAHLARLLRLVAAVRDARAAYLALVRELEEATRDAQAA